MGRVGSLAMVLCLLAAMMGTASAAPPDGDEQDSPLAAAIGGLRWGMSKRDVLQHLTQEIRERYKPILREAGGIVEEDRLYQRMEGEIRRVHDSFVVFDGTVTGWDASFVSDEFRHGAREAMLVMQDQQTRSFYFFIANRLWKWLKVVDGDALRGQTLDVFGAALETRFGASVSREGTPVDGARAQRWLEWTESDTRLRAVRLDGQYCLVFESTRVLERLAALRKNAVERGPKRHDMLESVLLEGHSRDHDVDDPHAGVADRVVEQLRRQTAR
jgi:hypothetical protein